MPRCGRPRCCRQLSGDWRKAGNLFVHSSSRPRKPFERTHGLVAFRHRRSISSCKQNPRPRVSPTILSSSNRHLLQPRVCRIDRVQRAPRPIVSVTCPANLLLPRIKRIERTKRLSFIIDRQVRPTDLIFDSDSDSDSDREFFSMKNSRSAVDRSIFGRTRGG